MRSDFPLNDEMFQWSELASDSNDVEYFVDGDDYLSGSMKSDIGIFHEPINTDSSQFDEYCGNFTFR